MSVSIKSFVKPDSKTLFLAHYMGWFEGQTGSKHIGGVCRSDDPRTIKAQVDMMQAVGMDGAIIDWYGPSETLVNQSALMLTTELERRNMKVAIMLDGGMVRNLAVGVDRNKALTDAILYAKTNFVSSPAYVQYKSKPLMLEFGLRTVEGLNMGLIQAAFPELNLAFQNSVLTPGNTTFAWVDLKGLDYLKWYLSTADMNNSIPCVFPGFDDHKASDPTQSIWGGPARFLDYGYGNTWKGCFDLINAKYTTTAPEIIQVVTWNDYEERTAIEPYVRGITGTKLF